MNSIPIFLYWIQCNLNNLKIGFIPFILNSALVSYEYNCTHYITRMSVWVEASFIHTICVTNTSFVSIKGFYLKYSSNKVRNNVEFALVFILRKFFMLLFLICKNMLTIVGPRTIIGCFICTCLFAGNFANSWWNLQLLPSSDKWGASGCFPGLDT